jgi:phosphatidylserine/phosphatidylglycerophosphate/cardiolipin synthase-like enzyme
VNIRNSLALLLLVTAAAAGEPPKAPECVTTSKVELRYSPGGGCTEAIVRELDNARNKVLMLAYSFTSEPITEALVRAQKRGVEVQAIIDSDRLFERSNCTKVLAEGGVTVYGDAAHAIQHQKVIIIDSNGDSPALILGSFNFTAAAEKSNAENICILRSSELALAATKNWIEHKSHSKAYAEFSPKEKPGFFDSYIHVGVFVVVLCGLAVLVLLGLAALIFCKRKK